ncbi:hypothetical protein OROHE_027316 [Orobanche hederae]
MTRSEARVDTLEATVSDLGTGVSTLRVDVDAIKTDTSNINTSVFSLNQGLDEIRTLVRSFVRGKGPAIDTASSADADINHPPRPPVPTIASTPSSLAKLELPSFSGENPSAWIARAEQFFHVDNTPEDMKLEYALIAMEGPTLHWLQWLSSNRLPSVGKNSQWNFSVVMVMIRVQTLVRCWPTRVKHGQF